MTVRLWFVRETELARRYCKLPQSRNPGLDTPENTNYVWLPRSVCEHTQKWPPAVGELPLHIVKVSDWFADKENL